MLGHGDFGVEIGAGVVEWAVGEAVGGEDDVAAVGHFAQFGPGAETAAVGMGAGHVGFAVETDLRGGVGVRSDEKRRDGEPGAQSGWLEPAENDRVGILLPVVEGGAGVEAGRLKVFAGQDAGGVVVAMPAGASRRARVLPAG